MAVHNISPFYRNDSTVLILGSFPSVKSREEQFFYAYRHNRFWKVIAEVYGDEAPSDREEKTDFLERNRIALWDVIGSCDIKGSSDSSIKNVVPNDISLITENAPIRAVFLNGGTSYGYYVKYLKDRHPLLKAVKLPSTSPANARFSLEKLIEEWSVIREYI